MKKSSLTFIQILIVLFGLTVLTFMLWMPHLEGRNVNATTFEIYFKDPFLAFAYLSSILFFTILFQAFKILNLVKESKIFSENIVEALQTIKYCGATLVGLVLLGEVWIFIANGGKDDITGGIFMGLLAITFFGTIHIIAKKYEKLLLAGNSLTLEL